MAIRPKTRRRLLLLLLITVVVIGGATAAFLYRKHQIRQELLARRDAGMQALEEGDYYNALHSVGTYLNKYPEDVEAVYAYAVARQEVAEPGGAHLPQAIAFFRRVLELEPGHPEARGHLLELYADPRVGFHTEALDLATQEFERDPDNLRAVRAKARALVGLRRFDEALPFAERYAEQQPRDFEGHLLLLQLYRQLDQPRHSFIAHAEKVEDQLPGEPVSPLLRAFAHLYVNDRAEAKDWAEVAAEQTPPDAEYARRVASVFDALGDYRRAEGYLERAAGEDPPAQLLSALAHRLWQSGRIAALLDRLQPVQPDREGADSDLLGLKGLALTTAGRREEATKFIDALARRENDQVAMAWHKMLTASKPGEQTNARQLLRSYDQALEHVPDHPYFLFAKGNALASMNEHDLAITVWRDTAQRAPAWPAPLIRIARSLLETGRAEQAYQVARGAMQRAPNSVPAALVLAESLHTAIREDQTEAADRLMQLVDEIQNIAPGEPRSAAIRIDLLARRGETDAARHAMLALLEGDRQLPGKDLLRLARISRRHDLGLAERCVSQCEEVYGSSAAVDHARAIALAAEGHPDRGRDLLRTAISSRPDDQKLPWELALARYLQQTKSPQATAAWIELAHQHRDNLNVQRLALDASASWNDLEFIARLLERLETDAAQQGLTWRAAKARYLLQSDSSDRAAREAARILSDVITAAPTAADPRLLAVEAYKRLGNHSAALEHLNAAVNLKPRAPTPRLEMAALLLAQGEEQQARAVLEQVTAGGELNADQQRRAAALFGQLGEVNRAIDLVVAAHQGDERAPDLLLASLYRRANRLESAEAICRRVLDESPSAAAVEFTADLLASRDQLDEARRVLDHLHTLDLEPGLAELVRGNFAARHEGPEQALAAFRQATEIAPESEQAWTLVINQQMALGDADATVEAVERAHASLPDHSTFSLLHKHRDLVAFAVPRPALRPLATTILRQPAYQEASIEAVRILKADEDETRAASEQIARIRQLTNRHPRCLPLQNLLVRLYMDVDQPDDAADIATRAMQAFPNSAEPAWMAAEALAAAGRWSEALGVSQEWRDRSANRPLAADMMIAEARMQLGQTDSAVAQLAPHLETALADPDAHVPLIVKYARAYIGDGDVERASRMLQPLLERSDLWRTIWVRLAFLILPDIESARTWLRRVEEHVPEDALEEHVELARAWRSLDERFTAPEHTAEARELLRHVITQPDPPAAAFAMLGLMDEVDGELETAEQYYRSALEIDSQLPLAANNLAMILLNREEDLETALRYARAAVEAAPRSAAYRDTLALALAANEQFDEAVRQQAQAVKLAPNDAAITINMVYMLARAGRMNSAAKALERLDEAVPDPSGLPESLRGAIEKTRRLIEEHRQSTNASADAAPGAFESIP